jgi:hypothetical protein
VDRRLDARAKLNVVTRRLVAKSKVKRRKDNKVQFNWRFDKRE